MSTTPIKDREPTDSHVELAAYINDEHGVFVAPDTVALVLRAYPEFRKTEQAVNARQTRSVSKARENEERKAKRVERDRTRLAKLEEQRAKLLANLPPAVQDHVTTVPGPDDEPVRFVTGDDNEFVADSVTLSPSTGDDEDF